jgi:hypothetical protein
MKLAVEKIDDDGREQDLYAGVERDFKSPSSWWSVKRLWDMITHEHLANAINAGLPE